MVNFKWKFPRQNVCDTNSNEVNQRSTSGYVQDNSQNGHTWMYSHIDLRLDKKEWHLGTNGNALLFKNGVILSVSTG